MTYVLHYAPDNASLIIRLALEHRGLAYRTHLVNRATAEQQSAAFRKLNPAGRIPVLETPQGAIFETAAILLWLADRHGALGPEPDHPDRGDFLKWRFFLSNTPHASLRKMFYADRYIAHGHRDALREGLAEQVAGDFATLDALAQDRPAWFAAKTPTALDFYTVALLRWSALYPTGLDRGWFDLARYPALHRLCLETEALPCTDALQKAEGLGDTPFTNPRLPQPPEGSAT